jgi:hypothetical protein
MFPELPDARMVTRKPIADSPYKKPLAQSLSRRANEFSE